MPSACRRCSSTAPRIPTYCTGWAVRTIKALRPRPGERAADLAAPYATDWIMLDSFVAGVPGGTGVAVDASAAEGLPRERLFVAGGLRPETVADVVRAGCGRTPWTSPPASRPAPGRRIMGSSRNSSAAPKLPDEGGHFGQYGGRYVAETLMPALLELDRAWAKLRRDRAFQREFAWWLTQYAGRPTRLYHARRLSERLGGAQIWLKREDLLHTGAHKINNTIGQALVARRLKKTRLIAETGAGQHGVATATVAALFGLRCEVFMGAEDVRRQSLNVFRMKLLGATVRVVESGARTLKDAMNDAMRDWIATVRDTFYVIGTVAGPHPYPLMVRDFQSVIGREARRQIVAAAGRLPDACIACIGGGSNAMGLFHAFRGDRRVELIGVEAAGRGIETGAHAASLSAGEVGVLHGNKTYLLQDETGQIREAHSISAGLDYPGVGPEHAWLRDSGRARYVTVTDVEAVEALQLLTSTEGIIPALESAHAIAHAVRLAPQLVPSEDPGRQPLGPRRQGHEHRRRLPRGARCREPHSRDVRRAACPGRVALVPFFTAGDPDLATTRALVLGAVGAGADVIELGVPFSDPMADGPVLQRSAQRAIAAGTTPDARAGAGRRPAARDRRPARALRLLQPAASTTDSSGSRATPRRPAPTPSSASTCRRRRMRSSAPPRGRPISI